MVRFLLLFLSLLLTILERGAPETEGQFAFNGFTGSSLVLDGSAAVWKNGLLVLTNGTTASTGHAFHPIPQRLREPSNGTLRSFSTSFVFAIVSPHIDISSHGMAFFISTTRKLLNTMPFQYLGLLNTTDGTGSASNNNHILAVELDTVLNLELGDIDRNHVGIDVNSLRSVKAASAGYYDDNDPSLFRNISLYSREAMQMWVDYDAGNMKLQVAVAPLGASKPKKPLLSHTIDVSAVVNTDVAYVGFSSSTGLLSCSHYVLGWSFSTDGALLPALDISRLPKFPKPSANQPSDEHIVLTVVLPITIIVALVSVVVFFFYRRMAYYELREDWEIEFEALHVTYKDLMTATKNFNQKHQIGRGGSGEVYKGILPRTKMEVAVKRVSHESQSGMKEFLSEVASIGRLRHKNLVHLLGYCRRKRELFLVYEYVPNGSLDKYLYDQANFALNWARRFHIVKCIASGLLYLHEEWGKVVVHRDIKASNILLDSEMNGLLGDFGLARLYERGGNPHTTHVVGTMGYLAPELLCTGKATPATDVFAFGVFLLEIACGRRCIEVGMNEGTFTLVNYVLEHWRSGSLVNVMDPRLNGDYDATEACLILKLGILCSYPVSNERPGISQVVQYLNGDLLVLEL